MTAVRVRTPLLFIHMSFQRSLYLCISTCRDIFIIMYKELACRPIYFSVTNFISDLLLIYTTTNNLTQRYKLGLLYRPYTQTNIAAVWAFVRVGECPGGQMSGWALIRVSECPSGHMSGWAHVLPSLIMVTLIILIRLSSVFKNSKGLSVPKQCLYSCRQLLVHTPVTVTGVNCP